MSKQKRLPHQEKEDKEHEHLDTDQEPIGKCPVCGNPIHNRKEGVERKMPEKTYLFCSDWCADRGGLC